MELEKIHGEPPEEKVTKEELAKVVELGSLQEITEDIVDSGAVEHSSDSDYEPPGNDNTEALLQAAAIAEKRLGKIEI